MPHVATKVEAGFKSSLSTHRPMARESARSPREHALAEEDEGTAAPARREDCRGILPAMPGCWPCALGPWSGCLSQEKAKSKRDPFTCHKELATTDSRLETSNSTGRSPVEASCSCLVRKKRKQSCGRTGLEIGLSGHAMAGLQTQTCTPYTKP